MLTLARNTGTPRVSRLGNRSIVGQEEREPRAGAGLASGLEVATQQERVLARDRETETAAGSRARPVHAVEAIEDVGEMLGRDAGTGVGDVDERSLLVSPDSDDDTVASVLECVPDE